nr:MFS transporter [Rhizobium sp. BK316]
MFCGKRHRVASGQRTATSKTSSSSPSRSGRTWLLLAFFGVGTGAYTLVLAWLPPFYVQLGRSEDIAGYLLAGLTLVEVLAGPAVSAMINWFPDRRGPLAAALFAILGGLVCLITMPLALALPAMILLGLGIGALFPLSLIVTLDHADEPTSAGRLTAFVQGGRIHHRQHHALYGRLVAQPFR